MPVKLVHVNAPFVKAQPPEKNEPYDSSHDNTAQIKAILVEIEPFIDRNCQRNPEVMHHHQQPAHTRLFSFGEGFKHHHECNGTEQIRKGVFNGFRKQFAEVNKSPAYE